MVLQYFVTFLLFISCSTQTMEITEDVYVICVAPMMTLVNKGCSKEYWETVARQNWNNNKFEQENFRNILCNSHSVSSLGNDVVGNEFVAEMVPLMMQLNKEATSKAGCEMVARMLWLKDVEFRKKYQKYCTKQASDGYRILDDLPKHELNIIAAFTGRVGKDTLRCVSKTFHQKIISQDELYKCYYKSISEDKAEAKRLLCYNLFHPTIHNELLEAIKDNNINIPFIKQCIAQGKRYTKFNETLYQCIEIIMNRDNNAKILKMLIEAEQEQKSYHWYDDEMPLILQVIKQDNIVLMRLLIKYGINVNAKYDYRTVLQYAVKEGKIEFVKELLACPDLDINKNVGWGTVLDVAIEAIKPFSNSYDIITLLLNRGANPDLATRFNRSCLEKVKQIIVKQMGTSTYYDVDKDTKWTRYYDVDKNPNWWIRWDLITAKSDPKLVDIMCLFQQIEDKKHTICGIHEPVFIMSTALLIPVVVLTGLVHFVK